MWVPRQRFPRMSQKTPKKSNSFNGNRIFGSLGLNPVGTPYLKGTGEGHPHRDPSYFHTDPLPSLLSTSRPIIRGLVSNPKLIISTGTRNSSPVVPLEKLTSL